MAEKVAGVLAIYSATQALTLRAPPKNFRLQSIVIGSAVTMRKRCAKISKGEDYILSPKYIYLLNVISKKGDSDG